MYADPDKVSMVQTWPKPENVKEVQQFIGLANYYAQYIRYGSSYVTHQCYGCLTYHIAF